MTMWELTAEHYRLISAADSHLVEATKALSQVLGEASHALAQMPEDRNYFAVQTLVNSLSTVIRETTKSYIMLIEMTGTYEQDIKNE